MNYHIIPQDKFFESYIDDIFRIHQEDNNVFWVRGERGESSFFHTNHPVEYLGYEAQTYYEYLLTINSDDKLFVSWYDTFIGNMIIQSELKAPVYVYLMGGDFYSQPEWWHIDWLMDSLTKRKLLKERLFPILLPSRKPWRWYRWFKFKQQLRKQYLEKLETIRRINYLVLPEHAKEEVRLVKELYPGCKAEHRIGTFDQNFEISKCIPLQNIPSQNDSLKVLLGNSADPAGNQLDAIHYLQKRVKESFLVYCLLSYGDRDASEWICDYGRSCLGDRFFPIGEYMEKNQYVRFLNEMDIVVMYHNRQQAAGAIMTALSLGKPVFIKAQSPLFKQLSDIGIKAIYNVERMHSINLRDAIYEAQSHRMDTIERLRKEYSDDVRLIHLKNLVG